MNGNLPSAEEQQLKLQNAAAQVKSGASWFYWIAALSIINSLAAIFGSDIYFVVGLGFNLLVIGLISAINGIEYSQAEFSLKFLILIFNVLAAGVFILFGIYANKRYAWAFFTGMVLYALDGLIFLMVGDYLSIGFHVFALFFIFKGNKASIELNKIEMESKVTESGLAQPIK